MTRSALAGLLLSYAAVSGADTLPAFRVAPSLTTVLVGVTVRYGCPTAALVEEVEAAGLAMGADYTVLAPTPHTPRYCRTQVEPVIDYPMQCSMQGTYHFHIETPTVVGLHYQTR